MFRTSHLSPLYSQNLLYGPDAALRQAVMEELPWADMHALLRDESTGVQEKALCLLRNLLYDSQDIIQLVLQWTGGELLAAVHDKLDAQRCVMTTCFGFHLGWVCWLLAVVEVV